MVKSSFTRYQAQLGSVGTRSSVSPDLPSRAWQAGITKRSLVTSGPVVHLIDREVASIGHQREWDKALGSYDVGKFVESEFQP